MATRRRHIARSTFASRAVCRRRPVLEPLENRALLATFTVDSVGDSPAGIGSNDAGDLRYCINQANANNQANTIVFDSTLFSTSQTITLSGSQLELSDAGGTQTITGPAAGVTISGGGQSRVFEVDNGVTASISGLTISGGTLAPGGNGAGLANYGNTTLTGCSLSGNSTSASYSPTTSTGSGGFGGALFNAATANLTLSNCTITGNSSGGASGGGNNGSLGGRYGGDGGGVANDGTATLTGCTLSSNTAAASYLYYHSFGGLGGGVFNSGTANLTLTNCTVTGNSSGGGAREGGGGGLANYGTALLTACTISDNNAPSYNGYNNGLSGLGAGVFNSGMAANLTLTGCTVTGNTSVGDGGGVWNSGYSNLALTNCVLSNNAAYGGGGVDSVGTVNLTDCSLSGNTATTQGGALFSSGLATLIGCTLSANNAGYGGGVSNNGATANLTNCTLSGNSSEFGGGIFDYIATSTNLTNCTVSGNYAAGGGGGLANYNDDNIPAGPVTLTNTIVAGNTSLSADGDIGGTNVSGSNNLIGTGGSGGLANGVDSNIVLTSLNGLGLAPLASNGGPTETMALLTGSPAIGAGVATDYAGTTTPITTDQRGEPLDTPNPDIGAFQTQPPTPVTLNFSQISPSSITYGSTTVTISGSLTNGSQAPAGETVSVTLDGTQQSVTISSGGSFSTTFDTTDLDVASSPYTITYAYSSDGTFASASTTSSLTVNPATLTIAANPETKVYGTADPALTYNVSGFQYSDTAGSVLSGTLTRAPGETVSGSPYTITQGTLAANSNYTIQFTTSTLNITPAPLTVTANPQTKVYGTTDPTLTDTITGLINTTVDGVAIDDTAATVLSGQLTRATGETVSGSPYPITQGTLAADSNYIIQFTTDTLTITPATPLVTLSAPGGTFTGAPIAATATVTGVNGTVAPTLEGVAPILTYYAGASTSGTDLGSSAPSAVGTYTVVASFPGSADYAAAQSQPVTFVIAPPNSSATTEPASPVATAVALVLHAAPKRKTLRAVTVTASIVPVTRYEGVPTGQVIFELVKKHGKKITVKTLGTAELSDGEATFTLKPNQVLNNPLTIIYNGAPDFLPSVVTTRRLTKSAIATTGF